MAKDRVISTVDPDARHGHKTQAHAFDGYKGHIASDPDSELITATAVTAGNRGDGTAVAELLADDLAGGGRDEGAAGTQPSAAGEAAAEPRLTVYGDSAYGAGAVLDRRQSVLERLEPETRWQHYAERNGEDTWVWEHRYQRQIAIIDFLADPGYSTSDDIAGIQQVASDVFPKQRLDQWQVEIWPRHLNILKWETAGHALMIGCPLLAWGLLELGVPGAGLAFLAFWLLVIAAEYLWQRWPTW